MDKWELHEQRSQQIADIKRRFLVAMNTGGIAITFALAAALTERSGVHPKWAIWPVAVFVIGLVTTWWSLHLAKYREGKRRDAAKQGEAGYGQNFDPTFPLRQQSRTWDTLTLCVFVLGVLVGLLMVYFMTIEPAYPASS